MTDLRAALERLVMAIDGSAKTLEEHDPGLGIFSGVGFFVGDLEPEITDARAALPAPAADGLDVEAAALAQHVTDAVNAKQRPVDDMGFASRLHHYAHQVADDRDDGRWPSREPGEEG